MKHGIAGTPADIPAFDVDGMLGGLVKWLRVLGYDAAFPRPAPTSTDRVFVTTAAHKARAGDVIVTATHRLQQLAEVLRQTGIEPDEALFFSRCVLCNDLVVPIPREDVHGKVPEYIFSSHEDFHVCRKCGRVYWEGSHLSRVKSWLEVLQATEE